MHFITITCTGNQSCKNPQKNYNLMELFCGVVTEILYLSIYLTFIPLINNHIYVKCSVVKGNTTVYMYKYSVNCKLFFNPSCIFFGHSDISVAICYCLVSMT